MVGGLGLYNTVAYAVSFLRSKETSEWDGAR